MPRPPKGRFLSSRGVTWAVVLAITAAVVAIPIAAAMFGHLLN